MTETLIHREQRDLFGHNSAVFNEAQTHRYLLMRRWAAGPPTTVFLMLNPSTADENVDDPTIGRCAKFARREGAHALAVVNLFGYRSPHPRALFAADNPVGERNSEFIRQQCAPGRLVIAAWGVHGAHQGRGAEVAAMLNATGVDLYCLGLTAGGQPRHPLYVRADAPLIPYQLATVSAALAGPTSPGRDTR